MKSWTTISRDISDKMRIMFTVDTAQSVSGGCINEAWVLRGAGQAFFVKLNRADKLDMFEAEAAGLAELARARQITVPHPVCVGVDGQQAYLVLTYLQLVERGDVALLGEQLAELHRVTADRYGWDRQNTIGSTPQVNVQMDDWVDFYAEQRLGFQLQLAARRGAAAHLIDAGLTLVEYLSDFFVGYEPQASLCHGDLWSGNYGFLASGQPVIYDPAVYYGDRETDIAMTELFGGFGPRFYAAYNAAWPLDFGYKKRKALYNLYHILNHFNIFGGGYAMQAESMIQNLLSEVK